MGQVLAFRRRHEPLPPDPPVWPPSGYTLDQWQDDLVWGSRVIERMAAGATPIEALTAELAAWSERNA